MSKIRILLLSGGNLVGQTVLDVLAGRRDVVEIIATNSDAQGIALFDCDAVYLVPPTLRQPKAFETRLEQILAEQQPDLVIPCRDDDVAFLADLKMRRPEMAKGFLCGTPETACATTDKWRGAQFAKACGLPFVPTLATPAIEEHRAFAQQYGYPLLVKPRTGFGSRGVFLVCDQEQLARAASLEHHVIQHYLGDPEAIRRYMESLRTTGIPLFHSFEGIKHSIQIFIPPDGGIAEIFCSFHVNRAGATPRRDRYLGEDAMDLGQACAAAFAKAGWAGPMNIQCQKNPQGELFIYEFNGRLTGATAARHGMGYDELELAVRHFTDKRLPKCPMLPRTDDLVQPRIVERPHHRKAAEELLQNGYWRH